MEKSTIALILLSLSTVSFSVGCSSHGRKIEKIFDYVFDAGTYTKLDYKYVEKFFEEKCDDWDGGKCSAVAKKINGEMIIGRNMDLTISNKPAYVVRTAVPGHKKTVGLSYSHRDYAPDYKDVLNNGVTGAFDKINPFAMDDILNEDGLYMEINMRSREEGKFSCSGTNPGKTRVYALAIARYILEECSTVDEAIKYLDNYDIYTSHKTDTSWNYAFMIADPSGAQKVIEFIDNKVCVSDSYYNLNFFLNEDARNKEIYQCGLGREKLIKERYEGINNEESMRQLMEDLWYFQSYSTSTCKYEPWTECVDDYPEWTTDYVQNHHEEVTASCQEDLDWMKEVGEQGVRDANYIWQSIFSSVVNLNKKTFHTTFYENKKMVLDIDLESNHIVEK